MGETVTAVLAIAAYVAGIALSLSLFLFALSRVLSRDPESGDVGIALAVLAGIWLLFVIGGGFFWFRLLSVGVPEGLRELPGVRLGAEDEGATAIGFLCAPAAVGPRRRGLPRKPDPRVAELRTENTHAVEAASRAGASQVPGRGVARR